MDSQNLVNSLAQGGGKNKRFQYCLNPYSSNEFLYFPAIRRTFRRKFSLIHYCKTTMLLPDDFAEYIYHIGNANELHALHRYESGLIPGGKSNRRDRQSVFFTAVNPMDNSQPDLERSPIRSGKTQNRTVQTYSEISSQHSMCGAI